MRYALWASCLAATVLLAIYLGGERTAVWWPDRHPSFATRDLSNVDAFTEKTTAVRRQFGQTISLAEHRQMGNFLLHLEQQRREAVQQRARDEDIPYSGITPDKQAFVLKGFINDEPKYVQNANMITAAESTGVAPFVRWNPHFDPAVGSGIDGEGIFVNVLEIGTIYWDHQEFSDNHGNNRITLQGIDEDGSSSGRQHATWVNSVLGAWGKDENAIGIAPRAALRSYGLGPDESAIYGSGMAHPSQSNASVASNRSTAGTFGNIYYDFSSRALDRALVDTPYHSFVNSAGNAGSGYTTLGGGRTNSKNGLTAGEIGRLTRDSDGNYVSGGSLTGQSSRGPTADGRIKPELVAHGSGVRAAKDGESNYSTVGGTSFAAPVITGSIALLADHFQSRFPQRMLRSASIRALLINGADDLGNPGPDYRYGFGAVNVLASAKIVRDYADNPLQRTLVEDALKQNATWSHSYQVESQQDVRVVLSWLDPAYTGSLSSPGTEEPVLENNLHIQITGPDGSVYKPYVMPFALDTNNTSLYSAHAIHGQNNVDPNLLVEIPNAAPGAYTIEVFHSDSLLDGTPQEFSLAVSGMQASTVANPTLSPGQTITLSRRSPTEITIPVTDMLVGATARLEKSGSSTITVNALGRRSGQLWMVIDTAAMAPGYWNLRLNNPDGSETLLTQAFLINAHSHFHLFWDMQTDPGFTFASDSDGMQWEFGAPGQQPNEPMYGPHGPQVLATNINGMMSGQYDISAITPSIDLSDAANLSLRVHHWINKPSRTSDLDVRINGGPWQNIYHNKFMNRWNKWLLLSDGNPWNEGPIALDASLDGQADVQFRFRLYSTTTSLEEYIGWYIGGFELAEESVPVLYPPVFTSDPIVEIAAESHYQYPITVSDQDTPDNELTWSIAQAPSWLTLSAGSDGTAVLQGTAVAGTYDIAITVADGDYQSHHHYTLTVDGGAGNTFALTYHANQADSGSVPEDHNAYQPQQEVTVSSNTGNLSQINHALVGWNTAADGTGNRYRPNDTLIMPESDLTLFAEWAPSRVISVELIDGFLWEISPYPLYAPESTEEGSRQIFKPVGQNDDHLLQVQPSEPN